MKKVEVIFDDRVVKDGKPTIWKMPNGNYAVHTSLYENFKTFQMKKQETE